jgi:hypothetical protein
MSTYISLREHVYQSEYDQIQFYRERMRALFGSREKWRNLVPLSLFTVATFETKESASAVPEERQANMWFWRKWK